MSSLIGSTDAIEVVSTPPPHEPIKPVRKESREYLYPAPQSRQRQSTLYGAIFNLSASILGGGVLSIPFCMKLLGIIFGPLFLTLIAGASSLSIYELVSCSRRIRHGATYEDVVGSTFGQGAGRLTTFMMFILCYLCVVAYTILVRDLCTPLLELIFDTHFGSLGRFVIVASVILLVMPLCLQKNLSTLGWTSIVSIIAMLILAYCVVYRGFQELLLSIREPQHSRFQDGGLKLWPTSWNDAIYAAPIFACSYTCHFNVLPLHRELIHPTRPRIKKMVNYVVVACSILYLTIGLFGYVYARDFTDGNILNNFSSSDPLATVGRIALAFCIISGLPMIVLPSRGLLGKMVHILFPGMVATSTMRYNGDSHASPSTSRSRSDQTTLLDDPHNSALLRMRSDGGERIDLDASAHDPREPLVDSDSEVEEYSVGPSGFTTPKRGLAENSVQSDYFGTIPSASSSAQKANLLASNPTFQENTPLMVATEPSAATGARNSYSSGARTPGHSNNDSLDFDTVDANPELLFTERALTLQTFAITFSALFFSMKIASVATLWNLVGSSACIILGFILPSACYLRIRRHKPLGLRMAAAWCLLFFGIASFWVCSSQTLTTLTTLSSAPKADTGVAPPATEAAGPAEPPQ